MRGRGCVGARHIKRANPGQHIVRGQSFARMQNFPLAWNTNHADTRPTGIIARKQRRQRNSARPTTQYVEWLHIPIQALGGRHAMMLGISSQFNVIVRKNAKSISLELRGARRIYSVHLTHFRGSLCRLPHHHVQVPVYKKNQAVQARSPRPRSPN